MSTDAVTSTTATGALGTSLASSLGGTSAMGKDDFLKLLTAQLQHQNPLQPMDNEAFVAQLAQFSSLEQMQNMNSSLATDILVNQSVNNSLAASLIGRDIQARGDQFTHVSGAKEQLNFNLASAAGVKVQVVDASGKTVATLTPGQLDGGDRTVTWDGHGADGQPAAAGDYTFKVTATDAKGNVVTADTLIKGRVTGVKFDQGSTYLMMGSLRISLSDVVQIAEATGTGG